MDPVDIIHNAIVDMKLYHETLVPQDIFNNAKAVIKRLQMAGYEIVPEAKMAANTFTIELSDQDRRRIDALCKAMCPTGTVAVVVYVETVGFTDGVHLFSSVDDAERWMLQEIRQHGGEQSHLTLDEFQKRVKPNEDFWIVDFHDRRR